MTDEVIVALWKIKEDIAREHDYDVDRLGAMVREKEREYAYRVVDRARSPRSLKGGAGCAAKIRWLGICLVDRGG